MLPMNIVSRAVLDEWVGTVIGKAEFLGNFTLSSPALLIG